MSNLETLIAGGVLPASLGDNPAGSKGFNIEQLTDDEKCAIEELTDDEVTHMISGGHKLGLEFFVKHCPHGAFF